MKLLLILIICLVFLTLSFSDTNTFTLDHYSADHDNLFFWRLQKVGSSSILSILTSYSVFHGLIIQPRTSPKIFCNRIYLISSKHNDTKVENINNRNLRGFHENLEEYFDPYSYLMYEDNGDSSMLLSNSRALALSNKSKPEIYFQVSLQHQLCNDENKYGITNNISEHFESTPPVFSLDKEFKSKKFEPIYPVKKVYETNLQNYLRIEKRKTRQFYLVRDPLSRMISIYYFWGELYCLAKKKRTMHEHKNITKLILGNHTQACDLDNRMGLFKYHGMETTPPDYNTAMAFAQKLPLKTVMPGPSHSWSAFSNSFKDFASTMNNNIEWKISEYSKNTADYFKNLSNSINELDKDLSLKKVYLYTNNNEIDLIETLKLFSRSKNSLLSRTNDIIPLVLEQFDISIISLRHSLRLTLADLSYLKPRKALSSHPKASDWPEESISKMLENLRKLNEFDVYEYTLQKLYDRLQVLEKEKVNFLNEIALLKIFKYHSANICLNNIPYLDKYKEFMIKSGYNINNTHNKLRDTDIFFEENKHIFSYNHEIFISFELCNICESHSILNFERIKFLFYYLLRSNSSEMFIAFQKNILDYNDYDWNLVQSYIEKFLNSLKSDAFNEEIFLLAFPYTYTIDNNFKFKLLQSFKDLISIMVKNNLNLSSLNYNGYSHIDIPPTFKFSVPQFNNCP